MMVICVGGSRMVSEHLLSQQSFSGRGLLPGGKPELEGGRPGGTPTAQSSFYLPLPLQVKNTFYFASRKKTFGLWLPQS